MNNQLCRLLFYLFFSIIIGVITGVLDFIFSLGLNYASEFRILFFPYPLFFLPFIGLLIFSFLNQDTSIFFIVLNSILIGFGYALFSSPNMNSIMSSVEKRFYGIASAMVGTMRLIGQMMSMAIAMVVFAIIIGRVEITPEYYSAFLSAAKIAFTIFTSLSFIGIFTSYYRGNIRKDSNSNH